MPSYVNATEGNNLKKIILKMTLNSFYLPIHFLVERYKIIVFFLFYY